jgi:hypothetical protein
VGNLFLPVNQQPVCGTLKKIANLFAIRASVVELRHLQILAALAVFLWFIATIRLAKQEFWR